MQKAFLYSEHWKRNLDDAEMRIDIWKTQGGIVEEMYLRDIQIMQTFSSRPYQLGQACDGTIDTCVHALFIAFCRARQLCPAALYQEAYSDETYLNEAERDVLLNKATLQGVAYPACWDRQACDGLVNSLTEINAHCLASVIESLNLFDS